MWHEQLFSWCPDDAFYTTKMIKHDLLPNITNKLKICLNGGILIMFIQRTTRPALYRFHDNSCFLRMPANVFTYYFSVGVYVNQCFPKRFWFAVPLHGSKSFWCQSKTQYTSKKRCQVQYLAAPKGVAATRLETTDVDSTKVKFKLNGVGNDKYYTTIFRLNSRTYVKLLFSRLVDSKKHNSNTKES